MAVTLAHNGVTLTDITDGTSRTVAPAFPDTVGATEVAVLTVYNSPATAVVTTPAGWTLIGEAICYDDYVDTSPYLATVFYKKGADSGTESVTINRDTSTGRVLATIDIYQRSGTGGWVIDGYEDDYEYEVDDVTFTGHNFFVTLSDVPLVVATFNESLSSPGWEVVVTGLDDYDTIILWAEDGGGTYSDIVVRGADGETVSDVFAVTDYEFPNFDSVRYTADLYITTTLTTSVSSELYEEIPRDFYVDNGYYPHINSWLRSVAIPELSMPVYIADLVDRNRSGRVLNSSDVLGAKFPVVTTNVMGARTGSFSFHVDLDGGVTDDGPRDVELLLDNGDELMLHHLDGVQLVEDPTYLIVTDVSRTRVGRYTNAVIKYEITYQEVGRPAPTDTVDVDTWQAVNDNNVDWQYVRDNHDNWLQVLLNP